MYISLILLAALMSTFQFLFNSKYQQNEGVLIVKSLKFSIIMSAFQVLLTLIIGFKDLEFTLFSLFMASIGAVIAILFIYMSINALANTNLTVYSLFSMLGKMLPPSLFAIWFLGEEATLPKIVCMILVVLGLLIGNPKEKGEKKNKAVFYYIAVFVLCGTEGICEKLHQLDKRAVNTNSYVLLVGALMFVISSVILTIYKFKGKNSKLNMPIKSFSLVAAYSILCTVSSLILLLAMTKVDASLQFPLLTGGTIVFSVIMDFLTHKKPKINSVIGAAIAFGGLILLAF